MDRIIGTTTYSADLPSILHENVQWYHADGTGGKSYFTQSPDNHTVAVLIVSDEPKSEILTVVMAHIEDDFVIIDADKTDKPLFQRLINAGIPREKIVLAYEGESLPEFA
jgi:hypothetical protein